LRPASANIDEARLVQRDEVGDKSLPFSSAHVGEAKVWTGTSMLHDGIPTQTKDARCTLPQWFRKVLWLQS